MAHVQQEGVRRQAGVILPAAGMGTRLGGQPKQYRLLGGAPLLVRTFDVFNSHPEIDEIIIVVKKGDENEIEAEIKKNAFRTAVRVVSGGATRQASVFAGLCSLSEEIDLVIVHDAVRPFVAPGNVSSVLDAISIHGAAALARPVTDTLRKGSGKLFGRTVSRTDMYQMQTPQGALKSMMLKAHHLAIDEGYDATDDVDLIQRAGYAVRMVQGPSLNIKVTTPADWQLAQWIWPLWSEEIQGFLSPDKDK